MNMSVEKKKYPSALPTNWPTREETARKSQNQLSSTGKVDVYYYRYVKSANTFQPKESKNRRGLAMHMKSIANDTGIFIVQF